MRAIGLGKPFRTFDGYFRVAIMNRRTGKIMNYEPATHFERNELTVDMPTATDYEIFVELVPRRSKHGRELWFKVLRLTFLGETERDVLVPDVFFHDKYLIAGEEGTRDSFLFISLDDYSKNDGLKLPPGAAHSSVRVILQVYERMPTPRAIMTTLPGEDRRSFAQSGTVAGNLNVPVTNSVTTRDHFIPLERTEVIFRFQNNQSTQEKYRVNRRRLKELEFEAGPLASLSDSMYLASLRDKKVEKIRLLDNKRREKDMLESEIETVLRDLHELDAQIQKMERL